MQEIYRLIELASGALLRLDYRETGTGKELVARTIHEMSRGPRGPSWRPLLGHS